MTINPCNEYEHVQIMTVKAECYLL